MKPPGKTTLFRMQQAAFSEAERIAISQDARVNSGLLKEPMPSQVALRDDFMGIVRVFDAIMSDRQLMDMLQQRMGNMATATRQRANSIEDAGDMAIDAGGAEGA